MNPINRIQNWYNTRNLDLSSLPPDIQQSILSQDPELIKKGRQLNKEMRNRLSNAYYENICSQPLTTSELLKYYANFYIYRANHDDFFSLFEKNKDWLNLVFIGTITPGWGNFGRRPLFQHIRTVKYSNVDLLQYNYVQNPWPIDDPGKTPPFLKEIKNKSWILIDIVTYFKILSNRLDCVNGHPLFAIDKTKHMFNSIITSDYSDNRIVTFLYLIGHLWLFKIKYNVPNIALNNPSKLQTVSDFIDTIGPIIAQLIDTFEFDSKSQTVTYYVPLTLQDMVNQFRL